MSSGSIHRRRQPVRRPRRDQPGGLGQRRQRRQRTDPAHLGVSLPTVRTGGPDRLDPEPVQGAKVHDDPEPAATRPTGRASGHPPRAGTRRADRAPTGRPSRVHGPPASPWTRKPASPSTRRRPRAARPRCSARPRDPYPRFEQRADDDRHASLGGRSAISATAAGPPTRAGLMTSTSTASAASRTRTAETETATSSAAIGTRTRRRSSASPSISSPRSAAPRTRCRSGRGPEADPARFQIPRAVHVEPQPHVGADRDPDRVESFHEHVGLALAPPLILRVVKPASTAGRGGTATHRVPSRDGGIDADAPRACGAPRRRLSQVQQGGVARRLQRPTRRAVRLQLGPEGSLPRRHRRCASRTSADRGSSRPRRPTRFQDRLPHAGPTIRVGTWTSQESRSSHIPCALERAGGTGSGRSGRSAHGRRCAARCAPHRQPDREQHAVHQRQARGRLEDGVQLLAVRSGPAGSGHGKRDHGSSDGSSREARGHVVRHRRLTATGTRYATNSSSANSFGEVRAEG